MTNTPLTPAEIPAVWCRMWSEDPALAHQLLTEDGRQSSLKTTGLDTVIGPQQAEDFVRWYRGERGIRFVPRTLAIDGTDRLAYTWDATFPDGTVVTGADVCVLRDGLVAENWTVPAAERSTLPDGPGRPAGALDRDELQKLVAEIHPWHRDLVIDVERQTVAGTWSDGTIGGIALLTVEDGRIGRQWSIEGTRTPLY
jgi:hypothetical protein